MHALRIFALPLVFLVASALPAQQKFPLRSGEWTATTPVPGGPPDVMLYCLNDETWTRALAGKSICQLQQLSISAQGANYNLACSARGFEMKGDVKVTFDGMTHMKSSGNFEINIGGAVTHSTSGSDYRWQGPDCRPDKDINLMNRDKKEN
jgi:hypothetical protein